MALTSYADVHLGAIVHVPDYPFVDGTGAKSRFGLVIDVDHHHRTAKLRGIFTNPRRGYAPIAKTYESGLDHDSYVANHIETIPFRQINDYIGDAPYDYDPFNDGF